MMTQSGRDLPVGTHQWHGPYVIAYHGKKGSRICVDGGCVVLLPSGDVHMFDGAGEVITPLSGKKFSITANKELFCTAVVKKKNV